MEFRTVGWAETRRIRRRGRLTLGRDPAYDERPISDEIVRLFPAYSSGLKNAPPRYPS